MKTAKIFYSATPTLGTNTDNPAITAVLAAEAARGGALCNGDAEALAAVLSDDLRYVHSNGKFEGKPNTVEDLAQRRIAYRRFEVSEVTATEITPEVVVLHGRINQCKLGEGKWCDAKLLFHAVWRSESGYWKLVSLQTALPPATKL